MAKVLIVRSLLEEIQDKFQGKTHEIIDLLETLETNPKKGKAVGQIKGIVIKELKYQRFRFYFIKDGYKLKFFDSESLTNLLIKFVRMSNKKDQQKVIDEIKNVLRKLGEEGLNKLE